MDIAIQKRTTSQRARLVLLMVATLVGISTVTRVVLLVKSWAGLDATFLNFTGIFLIGWLYDLANAAYFTIPLVVYLWLIPGKFYMKYWHRFILYGIFYVSTFVLLFNAAAEWFFWDEFSSRFNFIAVDYLVYTTEVIGNIQQSYPIGWIIGGITIVTLANLYLVKDHLKATTTVDLSFRERSTRLAVYIPLVLLGFFFVSERQHHFSDNTYANELAGNGMYQLFAAYRNNELDYTRFYKQLDDARAVDMLRQLVATPEAEYTDTRAHGIERKIINPGPENKLNVVLISVESFSADFMGLFGNQDGITPFLDSLANHSLLFTNLYATGTRTVRGLEALSLCVPPTPGQSIVRRPDNEAMFSLASVFNEKGYESKFIYGGYGYFDNMNYFFGHNGYTVIDRTAIDEADIDYENIWGVADENLFELAIAEIDKTTKERPAFTHIMTTSNHRPYTYPEGRIDIPSHTSRKGAVEYTDYAIGQFIKTASKAPWYNNTLFVIVADHCASSAGKTELPVNKYHIPMLIYSPSHISPGKVDRLMSQIDVGPTVLGILNFSYMSKFFGYDIFKLEPGRERAFISTYQKLGYLKDNRLVILSPQQQWEVARVEVSTDPFTHEMTNDDVLAEAIAWYQSASTAFASGLMKYADNSRAKLK